jgi:hypothetical protein
MIPWQRLTIYRYTLPPPYEATEHLFEELPLSTYPSGTTMEPLAYEMAPGAHLGPAAPWTQALVLLPRGEPPGMVGARARGMSFREACDRGYLRPYDPQRVSDAGHTALGGAGGAGRARAGHDATGRLLGACLLSKELMGRAPHPRNTARAMARMC